MSSLVCFNVDFSSGLRLAGGRFRAPNVHLSARERAAHLSRSSEDPTVEWALGTVVDTEACPYTSGTSSEGDPLGSPSSVLAKCAPSTPPDSSARRARSASMMDSCAGVPLMQLSQSSKSSSQSGNSSGMAGRFLPRWQVTRSCSTNFCTQTGIFWSMVGELGAKPKTAHGRSLSMPGNICKRGQSGAQQAIIEGSVHVLTVKCMGQNRANQMW